MEVILGQQQIQEHKTTMVGTVLVERELWHARKLATG
jgi:hypothetical protein